MILFITTVTKLIVALTALLHAAKALIVKLSTFRNTY